MLNFALRAGLVGLFFAMALSYTVSALPLPRSHLIPASSWSYAPTGPIPPGVSPPDLHLENPLLACGVAQEMSLCKTKMLLRSPEYVVAREEGMVTLYRRNFFKKLFHKIGDGLRHVGKAIAHGVVHAAKAVAHGVVHAALKVKHFVQTTGAKIVKVGLKIASTVEEGLSKVAQFIPVVGKVASKAMEGISTGESKLSDKIKAHIGGKLGQAMKKMDKARHIMGFIPREFVEPAVQGRSAGELQERELLRFMRRCAEQL